jgi:Phage integrase family
VRPTRPSGAVNMARSNQENPRFSVDAGGRNYFVGTGLSLDRRACSCLFSEKTVSLKQSRSGHVTNLSKQFARARDAAGLPKDLVLYCGRHDFGTYALQETGNLAAVMKSMGHSDVRTAMKYQHPDMSVLRVALNSRENSSENCHKKCHIPENASQQSSVSY